MAHAQYQYYKIIVQYYFVIPNNDSTAFSSMAVKFRSNDQDLYESKLNSLAVIFFSVNIIVV